MLAAETDHRDHAIIEQVIADLIDGPLAHLPSGDFAANAAWLTCAGIAHNLLRAAATLASRRHGKARGATLRRELINVPARLAHRGRDQLILHLPRALALARRVRGRLRRHPPRATGPRSLTGTEPTHTTWRPPAGPPPATDPPRTDKPQNCQRPTIHTRKQSNDHHPRKTITHYWAVDRG